MTKQRVPFKAEIQQLFHLMVHSLYSRKEIFLRELVSNASDALDKFRFLALTQKELQSENNQELHIRLEPDKDTNTLKIIDNGIGMSMEEVKENLGSIAQSGTKRFLELQKENPVSNKEGKEGMGFIGQFGVGFYSAFMVAARVVVHTQKAGNTEGVLWEAQQDNSYTIDRVPRPQGRGTTVTLYLKEDNEKEQEQDFTSSFVLQSLIRKYSDFISYPIKMRIEKEATDTDTDTNTGTGTNTIKADKTDQEDKADKTDKVGKVDSENQSAQSNKRNQNKKKEEDSTLNTQKALWLNDPKEVKEDEHKEFYRHISNDWQDPLHTIHFHAEGQKEFTALIYIPKNRSWDYYNKETQFGPQLYIRRVFILQNCSDLIPSCLRFVKGVVDSSDLSLNVSREMLQMDQQVAFIRKSLANKIFKTLKKLLQKDREKVRAFVGTFWSNP